jgi:hypothetical protein
LFGLQDVYHAGSVASAIRVLIKEILLEETLAEFCQRPTKRILKMKPGNSVGTELERRNVRPAILLKPNGISFFGMSVKTSLKQ